MNATLLSEATKLSVAERIDLVAAIWDSMAAEINSLPLSDDHRAELDRRLSEIDTDPDAGKTWVEVRGKIERGQ
ncbi:MAG: addiction module protein [Alphaproteobacteria bacterium]